MATQKLSVSLDPYTYELLQALARDHDRSLSYIICVAIQRHADSDAGLDFDLLKTIRKKHDIVEKKVGR